MKKRDKRRKRKRRKLRRCFYSKKLCYDSEEEANYQLELVKFWDRPGRREEKVYQCPFCKKWHMTSRTDYERPEPHNSETAGGGSRAVAAEPTD